MDTKDGSVNHQIEESKRNELLENSREYDREEVEAETTRTPREDAEKPEQDDWKAGRGEWLIIICICIVVLVVALDATILVPALPTIALALNASTLSTFWIGTSYLLSHAVVQPVISALSDIFGRRSALLASLVFFTLGTAIACVAHNEIQMLTGRAVQGIGGGGILVLTQVIVCDIFPLRQRPKFQAIPLLAYAVGTVAGPLVGAAFAEKANWRWIFYLNFPFCALGIAMVPLVVRLRQPHRNMLQRIIAVDWFGSIVFTAGVTVFLMAVSWGGIQYKWSSYQTLVPLIVGLVIVMGSLGWEARFATNPFIQLQIYKSWSTAASLICVLLQGFLLYLGLYYLALFFLSVKLRTPLQTGVAFLPLMIALLPSSAITGVVISRFGKYQSIIRIGWCLVTLGNGLLLLLGRNTPTVGWVMMFIIAGFGQGIVLTSLDVSLQASIHPKHAADAGAMFTFMRSLGMALGVGVGGAAFTNRLTAHLSALALPTAIAGDAEGFVQTLRTLPASHAAWVDSVLTAYERAFTNLFQLSTAVSALALIVSFAIRHSSLDKKLEARHYLHERVGPTKDEPVLEQRDV